VRKSDCLDEVSGRAIKDRITALAKLSSGLDLNLARNAPYDDVLSARRCSAAAHFSIASAADAAGTTSDQG
jgi:hypothetical protein